MYKFITTIIKKPKNMDTVEKEATRAMKKILEKQFMQKIR